jgi:hypothetical protein
MRHKAEASMAVVRGGIGRDCRGRAGRALGTAVEVNGL